jgi:hypothetical protein
MRRSRGRGELALERFHLRPEHEPGPVDDSRDSVAYRVRVVSQVKIREGDADGHATAVGVGVGSSRYSLACAR